MFVRRLISTNASSLLLRRKKVLKNLDISSPPNPLLDMESMGRNVRETEFTLFPATPLGVVLDDLVKHKDGVNLLANLLQRSVDVIEESDENIRHLKRKEIQSVIFSKWAKYFLTGSNDGYIIFSLFNRAELEKVAPKIHPDKRELLVKMITQPLLRIINLKRDIVLNPNEVMRYSGVDGFRSIMDLFHLNLRLLSGLNLDKLFDKMKSRKIGSPVHFEILRVWFMVWDREHGMDKPVARGSKWSLKKLVTEIDRKQSKAMLIELLAKCEIRNEIVAYLRQRHQFTGLARFPWSFSIVDEWMVERNIIGDSETGQPDYIESFTSLNRPAITRAPSVNTSQEIEVQSRVGITMVDKDKELSKIKKEIVDGSHEFIGISFVTDNVLSISTENRAYVIDLEFVQSSFVKYLVKRILNDPGIKIVYSLEAFLNRLQNVWRWEDTGIHFSNIIDLRRGRTKRSQESKSEIEEINEVILPSELNSEIMSNNISKSIYERTQHIYGGVSLNDLVSHWLGYHHSRDAVYQNPELWNIRPLDKELIMMAAHDSYYLILLEKHFRQIGFGPTEVLTYDPFQ
jgi:hypothetical protein